MSTAIRRLRPGWTDREDEQLTRSRQLVEVRGGLGGGHVIGQRFVLPLQLEHVARNAQPAGEPDCRRRDVFLTRTDAPSVRSFRIDYIANVRVMSHGERHLPVRTGDRKSTRLNSSHLVISYAVFCLKK